MNNKLTEVTDRLGFVEGRLQGLEESSVSLSSDASEKKIPPKVRERYVHIFAYSNMTYSSCGMLVTAAFGPRNI